MPMQPLLWLNIWPYLLRALEEEEEEEKGQEEED